MIFMAGLACGVLATLIVRICWQKVLPPIPDRGHRLFGASSERAASTILKILRQHGLLPAAAFAAGPTRQVALRDQLTTIGWFDDKITSLPYDAISLAVAEPELAAQHAIGVLQQAGFTASRHIFSLQNGEILAVIETNALKSSALVFRKPWYRLRRPVAIQIPMSP